MAMAGNGDRKALHAYVSGWAHDQWHDACAEEGVSVSAVLEALAGHLDGVLSADVVRKARKVDAERRRRGPRS